MSHMVIAFQRTGKPFPKLLYLAAIGEVCVSPNNTCSPVFVICLLNYDHDGRCEMVSHCGDAKNH